MKVGELKRWLSAQGVVFEDGTRHTLARLGSRFAPIPRHVGQEVKTGTLRSIMKQLGLKPPAKR
ncbi:MAG: type II toxin-antitoxin system HicA family toxin [Bryobacteraceae bacterium]